MAEMPRTPLWFKLWFAFCALLGLAFVGVIVWLIIAAISWIGRQP